MAGARQEYPDAKARERTWLGQGPLEKTAEGQLASERDIIAKAQQGEQSALAHLYEANFRRVYRFVLARLGNAAEAEDVTQEIFMKVLRHLHSFRWTGAPFAGWLFRIARNQVTDHERQRRRRGPEEPLADDHETQTPGPLEMAERSFTHSLLHAAIARLSPAQREVITLRFAADLSVAETAQALGKKETTVKVLQFQAVAALRKIMGEERP